MRQVAAEASRTWQYKHDTGFFEKYMRGNGLDIGYAGYVGQNESILPTAIGVDTDYPGYDGRTLPFANESQDYVYSSHCLEHIRYSQQVIQDWYRVTKINGFIVIIVPHQYLYEKQVNSPSKWNPDHKRFYTPGILTREVEMALVPNSYRIRLVEDGDQGFDYSRGPELHSNGQYEITLVLQKIPLPIWSLA